LRLTAVPRHFQAMYVGAQFVSGGGCGGSLSGMGPHAERIRIRPGSGAAAVALPRVRMLRIPGWLYSRRSGASRDSLEFPIAENGRRKDEVRSLRD